MPGKSHAIAQSNLIFLLRTYYGTAYRALSELSLRLLDEKLVPDIALYANDASNWHVNETEMTIPPLLAIEIQSPSQSVDTMKAKAEQYFAAGVRSVWIVLPALETVAILHASAKPRFFTEGDIVDEALDIHFPVEEVFA